MIAGIICIRSGNLIGVYDTVEEANELIRSWETLYGDDPHDYGVLEFDDDDPT